MNIEQNCLTYWFPKLKEAGLPVPTTVMLRVPPHLLSEIHPEGVPQEAYLADLRSWVETLEAAGRHVGFPCFLRTGQTSGKHNWEDTCYVESDGDLLRHVISLVEYNETYSLFPLPYDVWAVRELLTTIPYMRCDLYGGMPVCREFRFFVDGNVVRCWHPYWPRQALLDGISRPDQDFDRVYSALCLLPGAEIPLIYSLAERAGAAMGGGSWSVDILETTRGWYVTDMALAEDSYHWESCHLMQRRAA